jgi:uncharacterized protein (DUF488 family)
MNIYTIGFTKKSAEEFFNILIKNSVRRIIDTRLNNRSQLAGFTKEEDLKYFLKKIANIEYVYMPQWAPTDEILNGYRKKLISWEQYEKKYTDILKGRNILEKLDFSILENACLLCSEDKPEHCHRRLLAEYLVRHNNSIKIIHL